MSVENKGLHIKITLTLVKHDSIVDIMVCNSQATTPHQKSWFTWKWKELGHWIIFSFHEFCMVYLSNDRFLHVPWKRTPKSKRWWVSKNYLSSWLFEMAQTHRKSLNNDHGISWALPWFRLVSFHKKGSCSTSLNVRKWAADETQSPWNKKYPLLSNMKPRLEDYRIFEVTKRFKM